MDGSAATEIQAETAKKRCSRCMRTKALAEFFTHPATRDGRQSHCKLCHADYCKAHRATPAGRESAAADVVRRRLARARHRLVKLTALIAELEEAIR